jgi:hypothetical protein
MPYALQVVSGEGQGRTYSLPEDRALTIGRDASNDIQLDDRKLSRIHCQIEVIASRCQITDLNSTNGTMVNGRRITAETWLNPTDEVEMGMTRLKVVEIAPAEAALGEQRAPEGGPEAREEESELRCEECGQAISDVELQSGRARTVGDRVYCAQCCASFLEEGVTSTQTMETEGTGAAAHFQSGKELAGIRIISLIGEGRLGPLYKGEQVSMGRLVALKVLGVSESDWAKKYLHAVYTSGQLVHANIVLIFDTGEEEGLFYVVREYVEGQSAHERLSSREPMSLKDAHGVITQVAYALEHAFDRHIFHGSLSPRKILIGSRGSVKVTGFGLPQLPPPGRSLASYTWHSLPYTPPERLNDPEKLDFASDVYSTVAVFYNLLTGRPPFTGSTRERIERRIIHNAPKPIGDYVPNLPPVVQKILDRGLSKDPRSRYQLPREFLYDIEEQLRREM